MQTLSNSQWLAWVTNLGLEINERGPLSHSLREQRSIELTVPAEGRRITAMAYFLLMMSASGDKDESRFGGCAIQFGDREIWSAMFDRVGNYLLDSIQMRGNSSGDEATTVGFLAGKEDLAPSHAMLLIALLFQWDATVVLGDGEFVFFCSHDGVIRIVGRTSTLLDQALEQLRETTWHATERPLPN